LLTRDLRAAEANLLISLQTSFFNILVHVERPERSQGEPKLLRFLLPPPSLPNTLVFTPRAGLRSLGVYLSIDTPASRREK
jgi:hypothetical protein